MRQLDAECGSLERAPRGALAPGVNAAPGTARCQTQKATSFVPFYHETENLPWTSVWEKQVLISVFHKSKVV